MATIGIDLGTTNSLVSVFQNGKSILIPNSFGSVLTPSVVSFEGDTIYVGQVAKERMLSHPTTTFSSFKRFMGTDHPFTVEGKSFSPEELSSFVLRTLKEDAEKFLGEPVTHAVISVPAYFNDDQRLATKRAGEFCGLVVDRVINEPSAAALAARTAHDKNDCVMLIIDLGGGTLDVSLVECFENIVSVLAVSGDNQLGGDDFDLAIARHFCLKNNQDYHKLSPATQGLLLKNAETCKIVLTTNEHMLVNLNIEGFDQEFSFSRGDLVKLCSDLLARMRKTIFKVLADHKTHRDDIEAIILVGGGSKIRVVAQFVAHILEQKPVYLGEADHIVAMGVGIYAGIKDRDNEIKQVLLTDICPFSLGIAVHNEANPLTPLFSTLIPRNTVLPVSKCDIYHPQHKGQKSIRIKVYQGEQMLANDNLYLGELNVPLTGDDEDSVMIRFTYDLNGILEIEATPLATGIAIQKVLTSKSTKTLNPEEIEQKLLALQAYKKRTREEEEVEFLTTTANNIFAQSTGGARDHISYLLRQFLLDMQQTNSLNKKNELKKSFYTALQEVKGTLNYDPFENTDEDSWSWYDDFDEDD